MGAGVVIAVGRVEMALGGVRHWNILFLWSYAHFTVIGRCWDEFATRPMHLIISVLRKTKPPWR